MSPSVGYSGTPLARKLGIRAGSRVASVGAPDGFEALLAPLPERATVTAGVPLPDDPSVDGARAWDVVVAYARDVDGLKALLPSVTLLPAWDGGLWIAWPKKSSPLASDLGREAVREMLLATGMVDNKVCAIDEDWSGLRFVHRVEDRPDR